MLPKHIIETVRRRTDSELPDLKRIIAEYLERRFVRKPKKEGL